MGDASFFFVWTLAVFGIGMLVQWFVNRRRLKRYWKRIKALERMLGIPPQ